MKTLRYRSKEMAAWIIGISLICATGPLLAEVPINPPQPQNRSIAPDSTAVYAGLDVIDLQDLAAMRGGFSFGGLELRFGATLSTLIDSIKLETVFNITSAGAEIMSQVLTNLATVNKTVAALINHAAITTPSDPSSSTVTGPAAGVTLATGTPSAVQPTVQATQPTVAPSSESTGIANLVSTATPVIDNPVAPTAEIANLVSTAAPVTDNPIAPTTTEIANLVSTTAPVIDNPIAPTTPHQPSIAVATAGPTPTAAIYTAPSNSASTTAATTRRPAPATPAANTPSHTTTHTAPTATTAAIVGQGGAALADLAPADIKLDGLDGSNGFGGIVVSNHKGFTAALHKLTRDATISAVVSNASNQKISQRLNIKIDIQNVRSAREASVRAALSRVSKGMFR